MPARRRQRAWNRRCAAHEAHGQDEDERGGNQGDERQLPVHREHDDQDHDQRHDVADQILEALGQEVLEVAGVRAHAVHDPAGLALVVEVHRQGLQVGVHLGAQVVDEALAEPGHDSLLAVSLTV